MVFCKKGPLPFGTVVQLTSPRLAPRLVRESLFVLIQHNLIVFKSNEDDEDSSRAPLYRLDLPAVFGRLAWPATAALLEQRLGHKVPKVFSKVLLGNVIIPFSGQRRKT